MDTFESIKARVAVLEAKEAARNCSELTRLALHVRLCALEAELEQMRQDVQELLLKNK